MADDDKPNVIPLAWRGVITSADLGEPPDLTETSARELIDAIEAQGLEGEAGITVTPYSFPRTPDSFVRPARFAGDLA